MRLLPVWRCRYYPKISTLDLPLEPVETQRPVTAGSSASELKPPEIRRSARHLNPVVADTTSNEERWRNKNQPVIRHLGQGLKVREIANIVGRGLRQIRVIQERLRDIRSAVTEPIPEPAAPAQRKLNKKLDGLYQSYPSL